MAFEPWQPPTKEDRKNQDRKTLENLKKRWKESCEHLNFHIEDWNAKELLNGAAEALAGDDANKQAEALEKIRVFIAHHLLQKAIVANDPNLQSSTSEPGGGLRVSPGDIKRGEAILYFFSGTSGERILVSPKGLKLPWVVDEKHYTRRTNMLLREALKELFPNAQDNSEEQLFISLHG